MNAVLILGLFFLSCNTDQKTEFTGSTPAHPAIKTFLGISSNDSIDFIRWQLSFPGNRTFHIKANYGIGKPNTSGFHDGGKHADVKGSIDHSSGRYTLTYGGKQITLFIINDYLLHFLDNDGRMMIGNGGWSFSLNNKNGRRSQAKIAVHKIEVRDSLAFHGRTPCGLPNVTSYGHPCNKLKWYVRLYSEQGTSRGTYKLDGTAWRTDGTRTGAWHVSTTAGGQQFIQLKDRNGNSFLQLMMIDENIALFVDDAGRPYVGDEDFSYTLNRR